MKCAYCGTQFNSEVQDLSYIINNRQVRIINVPVEACSECGKFYIDDQEVTAIDKILLNIETLADSVSEPIVVDLSTTNPAQKEGACE